MTSIAKIGIFFALTSGLLTSCAHEVVPTTEQRMLPAKESIDDALLDEHSDPQVQRFNKKSFVSNEKNEPSSNNNMLFDWPVDRARLSRGFLPNKRRPHLGIDITAPKGTPILSAQRGSVVYAGRDFRGFGKMVLIESGQGWATIYAHLDQILVSEGQQVSQGETIGTMGRTGRATGVHLHFEIRKDKGPVDPIPLLPNVRSLASERKSSK